MEGGCHTTTMTMSAANDLGVNDPKHLINFTDIYKGKPFSPQNFKKKLQHLRIIMTNL